MTSEQTPDTIVEHLAKIEKQPVDRQALAQYSWGEINSDKAAAPQTVSRRSASGKVTPQRSRLNDSPALRRQAWHDRCGESVTRQGVIIQGQAVSIDSALAIGMEYKDTRASNSSR